MYKALSKLSKLNSSLKINNGNRTDPGVDSHIKMTGVLVVPFRG